MSQSLTDTVTVNRRPLVRTRAKIRPEKKLKNFNILLDETGEEVVKNLQERIYPSTKTEVFRSALGVLNVIFEELDQGSDFYIKKRGKEDYEEIKFVE